MEGGKMLSASRYDSHENSLNRQELHLNNLYLCIYISKYLCIYENFAVYETTMSFKREIQSYFLERLVSVPDTSRGQYLK